MRRSLSVLGLVVVLALAEASAFAEIHSPLSTHQLTDRAHVIVVGRAGARQTVWVGRELATLVSVTVSESLKGRPVETLTVALPGGIDRRRKIPIEMVYVGAPHIASGEEVLLFLERGDPRLAGAFVVSGVSQGKLSIVTDGAREKWVGRARRARLSDLRNDISRRVRGSAR